MAEDRLAAALTRIERALDRVEQRPADDDLVRRHARLKDAARETLAGLDRLLEPQA